MVGIESRDADNLNPAPMYDPFIAVLVTVPEEYFPDDDDVCTTAAMFVCSQLEPHLIQAGHSIADWIRGGCEEDYGGYFQSQLGAEIFGYSISFFPDYPSRIQTRMIVQYDIKRSWWKSLFSSAKPLPESHPLHQTMREFGDRFTSSCMLTQSQFDARY